MEFGIFSHMHVPHDDTEHARFVRELEVSEAADAAGFKYNWAPEHHFLERYSHQPAPEVYLSWVAAKTKRIHVGFAIVNITAKVNHPARVAERIATMDHLSEGRVEFGTGRGSSSAEWGGFDVPSAAETKPMWRESLEQIPRMWMDEPYEYEGKYFRMPKRNVLPKPYSKPHPPMWVACGSPPTFAKAGSMGLGAFCFTTGDPSTLEPLIKAYKDAVANATPVGDYVNDNILCVTTGLCMEDRKEAFETASRINLHYYQSLVFHWLDNIPKPPGLPAWPEMLSAPTPPEIEAGADAGLLCIGDPDDNA